MEANNSRCSSKTPRRRRLNRISSLPDAILLHILSFLETKDVVRTSILSRRWRDLWTSIPVLSFIKDKDDPITDRKTGARFIKFVDRTLVLHSASKLQKFRLHFPCNKNHDSRVLDAWIRYALHREVQEIDLGFYYEGIENTDEDDFGCLYNLPSSLFKCNKLISLKLNSCTFDLPYYPYSPYSLGLSSLTALSLSDIYLDGLLIKTFLDGCPMLEDLVLEDCDCMTDLQISSSSNLRLKRLTIEGCRNVELHVQAPNLQILNLSQYMYKAQPIKDASFLNEAYLNLNFDLKDSNSHVNLESLLKDLRHAKVLELSKQCIQVMSVPAFEYQHSYISKTKCLILATKLQKFELPGIASLLWRSHDLETLIIKCIPDGDISLDLKSMEKCDFDNEEYWEQLKSPFPCMVRHLTTVKISGFMGRKFGSVVDKGIARSFFEKQDKGIKLASFFLMNAIALEKMIVHFFDKPHFVEVEEWQEIALMVVKKLEAIPRAASSAEMLFQNI